MARYLFGSVKVQTIIIEADSDEKAQEILKDIKTDHGNSKILTEHSLYWGETPKSDVTAERDAVLGSFLNLLQNEIPRGSSTGIVIPIHSKPE